MNVVYLLYRNHIWAYLLKYLVQLIIQTLFVYVLSYYGVERVSKLVGNTRIYQAKNLTLAFFHIVEDAVGYVDELQNGLNLVVLEAFC